MLVRDQNLGIALARISRVIMIKSIGRLPKIKKLETMKRKKAKKFTNIHNMIPQINPESQYLLDQLDMMDKQFMFYASECDKLEKEYNFIEENERFSNNIEKKLETIAYRFLELEARYERDKKTYESLLKKASKYFAEKYGLNIDFEKL